MQMFLWTGPGRRTKCRSTSPASTYNAHGRGVRRRARPPPASPARSRSPTTAPADGCDGAISTLAGRQDRADRSRHLRLHGQGAERAEGRRGRRDHRQQQGGDDDLRDGSAPTASVKIPAVMVSQNDGTALKALAGTERDGCARSPVAAAADRRRRSTPTSCSTSTATA